MYVLVKYRTNNKNASIMKHLLTQAYEAPMVEVLEVKMELHLLGGSDPGVLGTRGDTYGTAIDEDWD